MGLYILNLFFSQIIIAMLGVRFMIRIDDFESNLVRKPRLSAFLLTFKILIGIYIGVHMLIVDWSQGFPLRDAIANMHSLR